MTWNFLSRSFLAAGVLLAASVGGWGQQVPEWRPVSKWSYPSLYSCPAPQAREDLSRRAARGEAEAQYQLGRFHVSRCSGDKNANQGIELLERAAAQGNVHAQLTLGEVYRDGRTGDPDSRKAVAWFEKAALADDARAQNNLGVALLVGLGATRNEALAARMFRIASQQKLHEAEYNLGTLYDQGHGMEQDYETARDWYESASEGPNGDSDAEYRLGILCEKGLGGDKDPKESVEWFEKAAEHGSFYAALRLAASPPAGGPQVDAQRFWYLAGEALVNGRDVNRDEIRGFAYVKKSADMRYEPAMFRLATMYSAGRGTPKNEAMALDTYERIFTLNDKDYVAYNNYAWLLVTADDQKLRNPQKALPYAQKAVDMSEGRESFALDTLARVQFQLGDVDKAIELQNKAIALAPDKENYQKALVEYQEAKAHPRAAR